MRWTTEQLNERLQNPALRKRNPELSNPAYGVASPAEPQRSAAPEPMAKIEREGLSKVRCLVRIQSFRVRVIDGDNLYIKDVLDALKESGAIFDDSPKYCQTEVSQIEVDNSAQERTTIRIEKL